MNVSRDGAVREPDVVKSSETRTYKGEGMVIYEDIQTEKSNGPKAVKRTYRISIDSPLTDKSDYSLSEKQFRALARLMEGI